MGSGVGAWPHFLEHKHVVSHRLNGSIGLVTFLSVGTVRRVSPSAVFGQRLWLVAVGVVELRGVDGVGLLWGLVSCAGVVGGLACLLCAGSIFGALGCNFLLCGQSIALVAIDWRLLRGSCDLYCLVWCPVALRGHF